MRSEKPSTDCVWVAAKLSPLWDRGSRKPDIPCSSQLAGAPLTTHYCPGDKRQRDGVRSPQCAWGSLHSELSARPGPAQVRPVAGRQSGNSPATSPKRPPSPMPTVWEFFSMKCLPLENRKRYPVWAQGDSGRGRAPGELEQEEEWKLGTHSRDSVLPRPHLCFLLPTPCAPGTSRCFPKGEHTHQTHLLRLHPAAPCPQPGWKTPGGRGQFQASKKCKHPPPKVHIYLKYKKRTTWIEQDNKGPFSSWTVLMTV